MAAANSGVTRRQSRVCFVDCKGILTPILRTWVQQNTLLLQNRGHAVVLKKDPFFLEIRNEGAAPLNPRNIRGSDLTPSDSRSDWASEFAAATCCR